MDVNITKEKKLTNMRAASSDTFENLTPPRKLTLEESLEFAREDECVEVTPESHEGRAAGLKLLGRRRSNRPDGGAPDRLALSVGPAECGATPGLHIDAEVALVPSPQRGRVLGLEEDAADACDSFHESSDASW